METKHTPGPWTKIGASIVNAENRNTVAFAVERDGDSATQDANARLIAAAPELLEALKGLDEAYCRAGADLTRDERHEDRLCLIAARAAIAKATGA